VYCILAQLTNSNVLGKSYFWTSITCETKVFVLLVKQKAWLTYAKQRTQQSLQWEQWRFNMADIFGFKVF
jgi:hypothetical protein